MLAVALQMMPEIPSRRDALPPAGVGGGGERQESYLPYTRLEPIVCFLMKMAFGFSHLTVDNLLSAMDWMCVGRYLHIYQ